MDDLRAFADAGTMARRGEVAAVQDLLDDELDRYLGATSAREVAPMIIAMRSRAEEVRRAELERFRSRSEDHTSELQSLMRISYAVICLTKKKKPLYDIDY